MEWEKVKAIVDKLYKRPKQFSDEYTDFSQEELDKLIATPDEEMACGEFMCIFQSILPAANYEEGVYFLPLAVKYIEMERDAAADVTDNVVWWMDAYKDALERDGLWEILVSCFYKFMGDSLSKFVLYRLEDPLSKGPRIYPFTSGVICAFLELVIPRPMVFIPTVLQKVFPEHFENIDTYPAAAWLVYLGTTDWFNPVPSYIAARLAITEVREHARQLILEQCQDDALNAEFWAPILPELDRLYGPQA